VELESVSLIAVSNEAVELLDCGNKYPVVEIHFNLVPIKHPSTRDLVQTMHSNTLQKHLFTLPPELQPGGPFKHLPTIGTRFAPILDIDLHSLLLPEGYRYTREFEMEYYEWLLIRLEEYQALIAPTSTKKQILEVYAKEISEMLNVDLSKHSTAGPPINGFAFPVKSIPFKELQYGLLLTLNTQPTIMQDLRHILKSVRSLANKGS